MRQRSRFEMDFEDKKQKGNLGRKRKMPRFLAVLAALAIILNAFIVMSAVTVAAEAGSPRVWTDKEDYRPEETVIISGENYTGYDPIEVKITRPDGEVEYSNTTADESGSFTTNYVLDGILGKYLVEATDDHGLWSYCTFTDGKPPSLFGWDWKFDDWTKSTLEGYGAGDWVWWHVKIYNAQPATYKMVWNHDYYNKLLSTYGFVEIRDVRVLYDDYPNENETGISVTVDDPWYREESNTILMEFNATFTIVTEGDYYLRWDARIDENETEPWPGKALHTHFKEWYVDGEYKNAGNQDVQVEQPLSPPLSTINGYKYWDQDEDGVWDAGEPGLANWTMHLTGEDIHGKTVDRYRTTGDNGYYQFAGIVEGLYNVSEELKEGWKCTNRSGDPPATGIINITSEGTNLTHIDFGNAHLTPDIQVTKTGDVTEAHEGDTVTYTVVVTNIGEVTLYDVFIYDDLLDDYYYKEVETGSDELAVDDTWTIIYDYTISSGDDDPLVNTVTANGTDIFGTNVSDQDSWTVDVLHPGINIVKTGPEEAHEGDTVTYTFTVTNTGDTPLKEVGVTDDKAGTATYVSGDTDSDNWLDLDETWIFTADYTIPTPSGDLTNTATASGKDNLDQEVTDTDDHTLDVLHPGIQIVKTGPAEAHEGDTVTYTFTVTNTGDCPLKEVGVTDDKAGTATYVSGDTDSDNWLDLSETWIFTADYTIPTPSGDVINTATASGKDNINREVTDTDDHTLDVLHPGIQIVKTGPAEAHEGDTVTYTFTVTNTGDCPLKEVGVTDDKAGTATYVSGDTDSDTWLDLDETWIFTADYTIPTPSGDVTNTATASGKDNLDQEVTDTDDHTLDVLHPGINIVKTGPAEAHEGDTVTYTFTVTNTGDCPLKEVGVSDNKAGTATYVSGDTDSDNWLDLDETWIFTADYTIPTPSGDVTNTATASGKDNLNREVTDTDDHTLDVLHPGINIVKTGPAEAHEGDTVTYTFTVTNTGDCPLKEVGVSDNKAGTATYVSGDTDSDTWLDTTETWIFTADYTIPTPSGDITNTATASGKDNLDREVTDTDDHTLDVLHPGIQVVKTGPAEAHEGDTVTYTFTVTNTGDCPLKDVGVTDDKAGTATYVSGDTDSDNWLDLVETWTFTADYTIPTPSGDVTNTATASGTDNLDQEVTDTDDHTLDVLHPGIQVVKTGPAEAHEGDTVTYTFTVTNTGDCPLKEVGVSDNKAGTATYVSGDTDSDNWLDLDETWIFTADYTIPTPSGDVTNTATASGKDNLNREVTDTDDHTLDVLHPGINIVKTGPAEAHEGDTVTYTFTVTNTGDSPLKEVGVTDDKAGTATYVSGDADSDNWLDLDETWIFTVDYTIPTPSDDVTNTGTASGTDNLDQEVTDTDDHTLDVLHPGINVVKTGPAEAHEGDTVTYTFTVTNTGDCPLNNVGVTDDIAGTATYVSGDTDSDNWLDLDETWIFTADYTIPTPSGDLTNTGTASGTDNLDQEVTDTDDHTLDVLHPGINIVKTGPAEAHEGDTVTFTFTVTNTGDCPLTDVGVTDDKAGTATYVSGDTDSDDWLDLDETWIFTADYTIPTPSEDVTNTGTASGTDNLDQEVTDTDDHTLDVLHPGINVVKTGPAEAHEGDTVTYTFTVTNTGDCPLQDVGVTDDKAGTATYVSGDTDSDNWLDLDETWIFTADYTIPTPSDDVTNTGTASGTDNLDQEVTDTDDHTIDVLHPGIQVVKTGPAEAHEGDTVTYTFTVTNTGDCPLTDVSVTDDQAGTATYVSGDTDSDNWLDLDETWIFTADYTISVGETDPLVNIATASGTDNIGRTVTDTDTWTIDILHPAIDVTKSADKEYAYWGEPVTYTFTVSNIGDCTLYDVTVIDTIFGDLTAHLPDDTLDVGESNTFQIVYIVPATYENIINVVTVTGTDNLGETVTDSDGWTVIVISLTKSEVTDTSFCHFDRNPDRDGQQFRLIFTQDPTDPGTYKLTASNPGQFYYNVFYIGSEGETVTLQVTIPYPFVTQGAVPIHVWSGVSYDENECYIPTDSIGGFTVSGTDTQTPSGQLGIALEDHVDGSVTITITGQVPASHLFYVTVHLDYGLKHTVGYGKNYNNDAIDPDTLEVLIPNYNEYVFSVSGDLEDTQVVENENTFKRNPGFGGLVTDEFDNPIEGYTVKVFDSDGILIGSALTDEDGYYFIYYKHKGKRELFTVAVYENPGDLEPLAADTVVLKANKFAEVNFVL